MAVGEYGDDKNTGERMGEKMVMAYRHKQGNKNCAAVGIGGPLKSTTC